MFDSSSSSVIENSLSDERDNLSKRKNILKKQQQQNYTVSNRYHRLKPTENLTTTTINPVKVNITEDEAIDSMWSSSSDDDNHLLKISPITEQYSNSSSSSDSSFDLCSNSNDSDLKTRSLSSGYESSLNSIPDHLFSSSPDSIRIPDCNLVEQFVNLQLQKQSSFDQDIASSSLSSTSSSFRSHESILNIHSPSYCRKCISNNQVSSDTDDDSQATTISTNVLPLQEQQNKRPRSLPIAIQQSKGIIKDDDDDDDDDETDNSSQNSPPSSHYSINLSQKTRFRPCELNTDIFPKTNLTIATTDKSNLNESTTINQKNSLEHFIMSPTDKVKIQMKYQENNLKSNELKISQPEDIDFKRSKLKAIRVLYQNRIKLNSISSPVTQQNLTKLPLKTIGYCDSPLAKRTVNPRLFRSALSCSVFEADDEHEVVSSSTRSGVSGKHEKFQTEIFNCLRINFIESLLHGKILPCGILDGFTIKLGASGLFMPKQVALPVTTFWFNVSEYQAASPYLGYINLQSLPKRGYHTPTKGTITLALLNPNGTAVHLFLIVYDLSDMPVDHRTFIRQRIVMMPDKTHSNTTDRQLSKETLRYLAHINFVTSQTGKLYMHSDIRLIFARNKLDYDERTGNGKPQLVTLTDVPTPKYWPRK
ncbi:unnamed protein product [Adineta steineri]|uniref:Atos-like conserved domain-containing protein n=1 Tax=Adineta steineri TaxID=433720 RepID=A0A818MZE0_9BILA|nr:unnamed protein product [Adineta steineri]CAF3597428.1 unnamed protein product [Adineta steineri]